MVPGPFLSIADPLILAIPVQDNGDILVDLQNASWISVDTSENASSLFQVRRGVAERLKTASLLLPNHFHFKVNEGWHPLRVQKEYFAEYVQKLSLEHPDWTRKKVEKEASIFVAPPKSIPPHTTGGAVDLTLVDDQGKEYNLRTTTHTTPQIGDYSETSHTLSRNITPEQKKFRTILISALSQAGFVNYPAEWWHWSYGDRYWAYYKKEQKALYGSVDE